MPLYEYRCKDCNTTFDTLVAHRDMADTISCKSCSSDNVYRLISTFATPGGYDDQFVASEMRGGGGCCGGSCGCSH